MGSYEQDNEPSCSTKDEKCTGQLIDKRLLKKDSAPRSYMYFYIPASLLILYGIRFWVAILSLDVNLVYPGRVSRTEPAAL
jgi:hypothetical protein